jgi:hypothetical protein
MRLAPQHMALAAVLALAACGDTSGEPSDPLPSDTSDCQLACSRLFDCLAPICAPDTLADIERDSIQSCTADCQADPLGVDFFDGLECPEARVSLCAASADLDTLCDCPNDDPGQTNAGDPCTQADQCDPGNLIGDCVPEATQEGDTGFVGGYCVAVGCTADEACGEGRLCARMTTSEGTTREAFCLAACLPEEAEPGCREGYTCQPINNRPEGACLPP